MNANSDPRSEDRARSEASFHDARILVEDEKRLSYAYKSVADVYEFGSVPPERLSGSVLEIGCFRGDQAMRLGALTGRYLGIDISPESIAHCRRLELPPRFSFGVDDANVMETVADGSIDYAFGHGVLHHLDLPRFAPALARKLATGGCARFVEPAQGNVLVRTFRKLTPRLRTPDEYPFDGNCIALLERHFVVDIRYQALLRPLLPMLLLNNQAVVRASRWLDQRLLAHRALQDQAWLLQIELRPLAESTVMRPARVPRVTTRA
jgi:SAM-dependent methyltransferase